MDEDTNSNLTLTQRKTKEQLTIDYIDTIQYLIGDYEIGLNKAKSNFVNNLNIVVTLIKS